MIQLFKEYYREMIIPYWDDVKDAFSELLSCFKS